MTFSTFSMKSVLMSYPMNTPGSFLTVFMTKILKTSRQNEKLFLELQDSKKLFLELQESCIQSQRALFS